MSGGSQGTQDPKPGSGPKGRPMEEAPKARLAVWDGERWWEGYVFKDEHGGSFAIDYSTGIRIVAPQCWVDLHDAVACVPPPVLP